jgi:hypothetical protein
MKIALTRLTFITIALSFAGMSPTSFALAQNDNSVREITRGEGRPVEIHFKDGRVAKVVRKERLDEFRVPIQLSENSCRAKVGVSCSFVMPFVRQQLAAIWTKHPSRQGLPLEYAFNQSITFGTQNFITRSQNNLFEKILRRIPVTGDEAARIKLVLNDKNMGRIECAPDKADELSSSLPRTREMLYWDENFENGNAELAMSKGFGARVNQTWRRFEGFKLKLEGATLNFSRFTKAYGMFTDYYPMGISYQIQMTFLAPNIIDASEESCALKWDISFTSYFTQLLSVLGGGGQGTMNPADYAQFEDMYENQNPYAQKIYDKALWEDKGMR